MEPSSAAVPSLPRLSACALVLCIIVGLHSWQSNALSFHSDCPGSDFDVIVVGAGISGLAAAKEIQDAGKSVVILEARDRIGGRITSVPLQTVPGGVVDIGAAWIHGVGKGMGRRRNPVAKLADAFNADYVTVNEDDILYDASTRSEVTEWKPAWTAYKHLVKFRKKVTGAALYQKPAGS